MPGSQVRRFCVLCLVVSAMPLSAATYTYTNGQNNAAPIQVTENSIFTIASGSATQGGSVSVNATSISIDKKGAGTLTFADWLSLGYLYLDEGTTNLTSANSSYINYLSIDYYGSGTGTALFRISGAALTTGVLYLGTYRNAAIEVVNGASLSTRGSYIGSSSGGNGSLLVSGTGSVFILQSSDPFTGRQGIGSVTLSDGGKVLATNSTRIMTFGEKSTGRGYLNIGSASGQAATAPGIYNLGQVIGGAGGGEVVFNHTSDDHYFTENGAADGPNIWVHGNMGFRVESGVTHLPDINTNTGNTIVTGGTLLLGKVDTPDHPEYSAVGTGTVTVGMNGTLGGNGRVNGLTTISGLLSPGDTKDSVGLMDFAGGLALNSESVTRMELGGFGRGTGYDAIDVNGAFAYGGTLQLVLIDGFDVALGDTFDLFGGSFIPSGTFASVTLNSPDFAAHFDPSTGVVTIVVPEPSTFILAVTASALALWRGRRRRLSGSSLRSWGRGAHPR